jgi:hypothetical protein
VKHASSVSVIEDEIVVVLGRSQLLSVFHYVTHEGNVQEQFIRYTDISEVFEQVLT